MTDKWDRDAAEGDTLRALDFPIVCSMTHAAKWCERTATHIATVHKCLEDVGNRIPVCDYFLLTTEAAHYPAKCGICGKIFKQRSDYVWNIEKF